MRTREQIEAQTSEAKPQNTPRNKESKAAKTARIAPWMWKPGQSGNPGGRPKLDMRQLIARAIFENNPELIYKAYSKLLAKGSAFGYQVVGEAAYGKLKETRDTGSDVQDIPDDQLNHAIANILRKLGLASEIDAASRAGSADQRAEAPSGEAKDTDVLSR